MELREVATIQRSILLLLLILLLLEIGLHCEWQEWGHALGRSSRSQLALSVYKLDEGHRGRGAEDRRDR